MILFQKGTKLRRGGCGVADAKVALVGSAHTVFGDTIEKNISSSLVEQRLKPTQTDLH
ncbi:MAG: hypothetical protein ACKO96_34510 [Flammeovirgaceae bacterium]